MVEGSQLTLAEECHLVLQGRLQRKLAALMIELADLGCLEVRDGKILLVDCAAPVEPLLARALNALRDPPISQSVPDRLGALEQEFSWDDFPERLVEQGVLTRHRFKKVLSQERGYPEVGPQGRALRDQVGRVLLEDAEPDARTAMLVSLLAFNNEVPSFVGVDRNTKKPTKAIVRAGEIAERTAAQGLPGGELLRLLFECRAEQRRPAGATDDEGLGDIFMLDFSDASSGSGFSDGSGSSGDSGGSSSDSGSSGSF